MFVSVRAIHRRSTAAASIPLGPTVTDAHPPKCFLVSKSKKRTPMSPNQVGIKWPYTNPKYPIRSDEIHRDGTFRGFKADWMACIVWNRFGILGFPMLALLIREE